jgi:transcription termination factor NusA
MDGKELIQALRFIEREKGVPFDTLLGDLEEALAVAYKRKIQDADEARVEIDPETGEMVFWRIQIDPETGETTERDDTPSDFGRVAASTVKQVIVQRMREAERDRTFGEYEGRVGDIVTGIVQQHDRHITVDLGNIEAELPYAEQVPSEHYQHNDRIKVYVVDVARYSRSDRGPRVVVSRTHPNLIKRLFELEVPEIADGIVEITNVAREPGHRTKIAVRSNDPGVDPKGACVGPRGSRVRMVVNELRGEKIDIVLHADDPAQFVAEALSPAKVQRVTIDEAEKTAHVTVPDYQLSLAIGKEGQNARLAARLTGWRIDIASDRAGGEPKKGDRVYEPGAGRGDRRGGGAARPGRHPSNVREA